MSVRVRAIRAIAATMVLGSLAFGVGTASAATSLDSKKLIHAADLPTASNLQNWTELLTGPIFGTLATSCQPDWNVSAFQQAGPVQDSLMREFRANGGDDGTVAFEMLGLYPDTATANTAGNTFRHWLSKCKSQFVTVTKSTHSVVANVDVWEHDFQSRVVSHEDAFVVQHGNVISVVTLLYRAPSLSPSAYAATIRSVQKHMLG